MDGGALVAGASEQQAALRSRRGGVMGRDGRTAAAAAVAAMGCCVRAAPEAGTERGR